MELLSSLVLLCTCTKVVGRGVEFSVSSSDGASLPELVAPPSSERSDSDNDRDIRPGPVRDLISARTKLRYSSTLGSFFPALRSS